MRLLERHSSACDIGIAGNRILGAGDVVGGGGVECRERSGIKAFAGRENMPDYELPIPDRRRDPTYTYRISLRCGFNLSGGLVR